MDTLPCRRCDALGRPRDLAGEVMPWTHVNRGERRKSTHGMSGTAGKRERPRTHETHDRTWMEKSGQPPDESLADDTARSKYRRRKAMTYMSSGRSVGLQLVLRSRHAGQGGGGGGGGGGGAGGRPPPPLQDFAPPAISANATSSGCMLASVDAPKQSPLCKQRHRRSACNGRMRSRRAAARSRR